MRCLLLVGLSEDGMQAGSFMYPLGDQVGWVGGGSHVQEAPTHGAVSSVGPVRLPPTLRVGQSDPSSRLEVR